MIDIIYNGKYLQYEVQGLKILQVTGREVTGYDIDEKEIGGLNGSTYLSSRIEPRDIKVKFTLAAPTKEAYRIRMNKLNNLLQAREVQLIFADELDKYFVASSAEADGSKIVFHCSDPFKYSVTEKSIPISGNTLMVTNDGTVPASIRYEIKLNKENGYLGIASNQGAMEFGKREEANGQTYQQTEYLAGLPDFIAAADDKTSIDAMHPTYGTKGTLTTRSYNGRTYLTLGSVGTLVGNANGGMRTVNLKPDSNGNATATNWDIYMHLIMWASAMGQTGEMSISVLTADGKLIAGCNWFKTDMSGNQGYYEIIVYNPDGKDTDLMKGRILRTWTYQTDHRHELNPWYGDWGHCMMRKEGSKFTFFYRGGYHTFIVPEAANLVAAKIQISCKAWRESNGKNLYIHGFDVFDFRKMGVSKWRDVPNRFRPNSTLTIDGETTQFLVNGMRKPEEEVLGTEYFKVPPGDTEIKLVTSSWYTGTLTGTAYIRERWL
ncbi:distal tail protein Dit [Faecalibaculum rodentium]|uniref:distal tail protein Dit n=1 Tax=Faecalibaculum rodentium TaxID=1702221 RepID=UPI0023F0419C|nr:distal tail protein Dit [Faecalibaculum rodentium]